MSRSFSHALPLQSQHCLSPCSAHSFSNITHPDFEHNFLFLHSCLPIINERETSTQWNRSPFPGEQRLASSVPLWLSLARLWCWTHFQVIVAEALVQFPGALILLPGSRQRRTVCRAFLLEFFFHHMTKGRPSGTVLFFVMSHALGEWLRTRADAWTEEKRLDETELRCSYGVLISGLMTQRTNAKTLGMYLWC